MKSRFIQLKEDLVTLSKLSNDVFNILDNQTLHFLLTTFPEVPEDDSCMENIYSMVIFEDILDFSALMIKGLLRVRRDLKRQKQVIKYNETEVHKSKAILQKASSEERHDHDEALCQFDHLPFEGDEEIICVQPRECPVCDDVPVHTIAEKAPDERSVLMSNDASGISDGFVNTKHMGCDEDKMQDVSGNFDSGSISNASDCDPYVAAPWKSSINVPGKIVSKGNQGSNDNDKEQLQLMQQTLSESSLQADESEVNIEDAEEFCCGDCGKVFSHHGSLIRHTYSSHSTQISSFYKCKTCRKLFTSFDQYKGHECLSKGKRRSVSAVMSQLLLEQTGDRSALEPTCDRTLPKTAFTHEECSNDHQSNQSDLASSHCDSNAEERVSDSFQEDMLPIVPQLDSTDTKSFACGKCKFVFPSIKDLKMHSCTPSSERNHYVGKYERPNYSRYTDSRPTLATMSDPSSVDGALQSNSRARGRLCKLCGGYFATYSALIDHRHIHIREYPFQCSSCEKAYKTAGELKRHQHVHTGERPYGCEFCGRYFALSHHLKRHVQTHLES